MRKQRNRHRSRVDPWNMETLEGIEFSLIFLLLTRYSSGFNRRTSRKYDNEAQLLKLHKCFNVFDFLSKFDDGLTLSGEAFHFSFVCAAHNAHGKIGTTTAFTLFGRRFYELHTFYTVANHVSFGVIHFDFSAQMKYYHLIQKCMSGV